MWKQLTTIIGLGAIAASAGNAWVVSAIVQPPSPHTSTAPDPNFTMKSTVQADIDTILERNIFGYIDDTEPVVDETEPTSIVDLDLTLIGTIADGHGGAAVIRLNSPVAATNTFLIGHVVKDGFVVDRISPSLVILRNGDRMAKLEPARSDPVSSRRRTRSEQKPEIRNTAEPSSAGPSTTTPLPGVETNGRETKVSQDFFQHQMENIGPLLRSFKALPHVDEDGQVIGFRVSNVMTGSLIERIGIRDKDIIVAIDDVPLNDAGTGIRALSAARKNRRLTATILRGDKEFDVNLEVQ